MIKTPEPGQVVPHPHEWIVVTQEAVGPLSGNVYFTKRAQFVLEQDAYDFAKSIKCFHTAVVAPVRYE